VSTECAVVVPLSESWKATKVRLVLSLSIDSDLVCGAPRCAWSCSSEADGEELWGDPFLSIALPDLLNALGALAVSMESLGSAESEARPFLREPFDSFDGRDF
jgi:hypothetical protein